MIISLRHPRCFNRLLQCVEMSTQPSVPTCLPMLARLQGSRRFWTVYARNRSPQTKAALSMFPNDCPEAEHIAVQALQAGS